MYHLTDLIGKTLQGYLTVPINLLMKRHFTLCSMGMNVMGLHLDLLFDRIDYGDCISLNRFHKLNT